MLLPRVDRQLGIHCGQLFAAFNLLLSKFPMPAFEQFQFLGFGSFKRQCNSEIIHF